MAIALYDYYMSMKSNGVGDILKTTNKLLLISYLSIGQYQYREIKYSQNDFRTVTPRC